MKTVTDLSPRELAMCERRGMTPEQVSAYVKTRDRIHAKAQAAAGGHVPPTPVLSATAEAIADRRGLSPEARARMARIQAEIASKSVPMMMAAPPPAPPPPPVAPPAPAVDDELKLLLEPPTPGVAPLFASFGRCPERMRPLLEQAAIRATASGATWGRSVLTGGA
jgi:hypothetical protein